MKKTVCSYIMIILLSLQGCSSVSNISGTYVNKNDPNIINYLQLNKDMTYIHYYKKDSTSLMQRGVWKIISNPYNGIDLNQFCNYNEEGLNYKKFATYILVIDGKRLNTGFDGNNESSFEKE
jgi:hypothetical protein